MDAAQDVLGEAMLLHGGRRTAEVLDPAHLLTQVSVDHLADPVAAGGLLVQIGLEKRRNSRALPKISPSSVAPVSSARAVCQSFTGSPVSSMPSLEACIRTLAKFDLRRHTVCSIGGAATSMTP